MQENSSPGHRIRSLRFKKGMTLRELADASGLSEAHVSRLETGSSGIRVSRRVAERFAEVLGVSADHILTGLPDDPVRRAEALYYKAIEESGLQDKAQETLQEISSWLRKSMTSDSRGRGIALKEINNLASHFMNEVAARNAPVKEAAMKMAQAVFRSPLEENIFDRFCNADIGGGVEKWNDVRKRILARLSVGTATKAEIARATGLSRQLVHEYLKGGAVPTFDRGILLLSWVSEAEGLKTSSGSGGVDAPPKPEAQPEKTSINAKSKPDPTQR